MILWREKKRNCLEKKSSLKQMLSGNKHTERGESGWVFSNFF